jgi:hypothetical protein
MADSSVDLANTLVEQLNVRMSVARNNLRRDFFCMGINKLNLIKNYFKSFTLRKDKKEGSD